MSRYSLQEFVEKSMQKDLAQGFFELESDRMLEVNLADHVWMKMGAMIAYTGQVKFEREGVFEHGFMRFLKSMFSGEAVRLTKAVGAGKVYIADAGKKVTILQLENESITVNGSDLLAFEPSVEWDIKMVKRIGGAMAGGLFNIRLSGSGMVAITTHYDPMTLKFTPGNPVITDPNATVAWSGHIEPSFKADVSMKTFLGRGSGDSIQMRFEGEGFVVVQPFEEIPVLGAQ
ncbi:MAG: AIM24 family protein [Deltaproteobacteria bacterium]|nr:AIM24 family protein [Deltaproteobacteria bacterium]